MKQIRTFNKAAAKLGFTLIELSIVLVIIGLIVGGILVGQDLIKAAEIRSTVGQLEKYSTAVNTFRGKYNGLNGDLANATNLGFETRSPGDGDGQLESASNTSATFHGEVSCFWDDLSTAGMISDSLNASTTCGTYNNPGTAVGTVLPLAKLGRGNYILTGSVGGINYWGLSGVSSISTGVYALSDRLTGSEAFQIDAKLDDGAPSTGSVIAMEATTGGPLFDTPEDAATAAAGVCNVTGNVYNFTTSSGNDAGCQLRIRANF